MATALQLVNRVRRELRWGDTADFTDDLSKVVLDRLNDAQATIFETWDWDCDVRHDGELTTFAKVDDFDCIVTNGSTVITSVNASLSADLLLAYERRAALRFVVTTDATQSDIAGRIAWGQNVVSGIWAYFAASAKWLGSTTSTTSAMDVFANQYGLPSTVRKVLSVTSQGQDVRLTEVGREQMYDRYVQRPHEEVSDDVSLVIIGGTLAVTGLRTEGITIAPTEEVYNSILLYPTPSSAYRLNYSYLIQRSDLSAATDVFRADRSLETALVKLAFARCMQDAVGDFNPEAGMALEQRVIRELAALHGNEMRDPGRHRVLGSNFCETSNKIDFGRLPRNYGTGT